MKDKQTAIEWLEDNLNFEPYDEEEFISNNKIWEQAKEMEKEQILNACHHGVDYDKSPYKNAEEYYNETYGK